MTHQLWVTEDDISTVGYRWYISCGLQMTHHLWVIDNDTSVMVYRWWHISWELDNDTSAVGYWQRHISCGLQVMTHQLWVTEDDTSTVGYWRWHISCGLQKMTYQLWVTNNDTWLVKDNELWLYMGHPYGLVKINELRRCMHRLFNLSCVWTAFVQLSLYIQWASSAGVSSSSARSVHTHG